MYIRMRDLSVQLTANTSGALASEIRYASNFTQIARFIVDIYWVIFFFAPGRQA
jgi:hypothetical protein